MSINIQLHTHTSFTVLLISNNLHYDWTLQLYSYLRLHLQPPPHFKTAHQPLPHCPHTSHPDITIHTPTITPTPHLPSLPYVPLLPHLPSHLHFPYPHSHASFSLCTTPTFCTDFSCSTAMSGILEWIISANKLSNRWADLQQSERREQLLRQ